MKKQYYVGLTVLFIAMGAFAYFPGNAWAVDKCVGDTVEVAGICVPSESGLSKKSIVDIITALMYWLLLIFGALAIIAFVIAGSMYLTAVGNENQIDSAKRAMTYSIVGIIVALIGLTVVYAVTNWLGGSSYF